MIGLDIGILSKISSVSIAAPQRPDHRRAQRREERPLG